MGTRQRRRRSWWSRVLWTWAAGFLFGLAILHPLATVIDFRFFPRLAQEMEEAGSGSFWAALVHAFHLELVPMGLILGLFMGGIALIAGHYRSRLASQRDRLASSAQALTEKNERLVKLEQSNRRHVQFMVHDFKGHLSVIAGFVEHLLEKKESSLEPAVLEALRTVRRQTRRMGGTVMDLLEFARLKEAPALRREPTKVWDLLQSAAADISFPAGSGQIRVGPRRWHCPEVTVDRQLVRRVLVNLALNALKHNRPGTRVVLDAYPIPQSGEIAFTCTDDGRGLSAAALGSLFKEFGTRQDAGQEDSTGLGLAFCKTAVEAHGGRIWCETSERKGARFTFTIPLEAKGASNVDRHEATHPGSGRRAGFRRPPQDAVRGRGIHGDDGVRWRRSLGAREGDASRSGDAGHSDAAQDWGHLLPSHEV